MMIYIVIFAFCRDVLPISQLTTDDGHNGRISWSHNQVPSVHVIHLSYSLIWTGTINKSHLDIYEVYVSMIVILSLGYILLS